MSLKEFDVVIVGGGIAGAGIALEASQRGLRVLLVDRADFGGEASAGCFGILHGGVRYLQQLDLPRLLESAREQQILRCIAPNHFRPLPIVFPCRGVGMKSRWVLSSAVRLFEALANFRNSAVLDEVRLPELGQIGATELAALFPGFRDPVPTSGIVYHDALFSSTQRFLMAVIRSAVRAGAQFLNYWEVDTVSSQHGTNGGQLRWNLQIKDKLSGEATTVRCAWIINATGHRVEEFYNEKLARHCGSGELRSRQFVKAVQLVIPKISDYGLALESSEPDAGNKISRGGRSFFLVPSGPHTLVGTYEQVAEPQDPFYIGPEEISVFLQSLMQSYRFEAPPVVLSSWGGYIPLEWVKEGSTYSAARDDLLLDHSLSHQVMSVAAVKYSTFRRTAQRVVDRLSRAFGDRLSTSISHRIPLVGSETIGFEDFRNRFRELISSYADEVDAEYLYRTYGSSIEELSKLRSKSDIRSFFELEIAYLREYEFARLPDDILKRRLSIARTSDLDDRARSRLMDLF